LEEWQYCFCFTTHWLGIFTPWFLSCVFLRLRLAVFTGVFFFLALARAATYRNFFYELPDFGCQGVLFGRRNDGALGWAKWDGWSMDGAWWGG
jgi:hypothetical protein